MTPWDAPELGCDPGWGCPFQSSPSLLPPVAMVTHLIPKLRLQLCAAYDFLCGQSPFPNTNFLEEKGRKIQATLVIFWEVMGTR